MERRLTAIREQVVRLQELVQSQQRLLSQGIVLHSDESASAIRRFQFITGPSNLVQISEELRKGVKKCWRHKPSDISQAEMSLNLLRQGLAKSNKLFLDLRLEARARLNHSQYWSLMERIGEKSRQSRSKEQKKLRYKEKNLKRRSEDCGRHILCRWMRGFSQTLRNTRK